MVVTPVRHGVVYADTTIAVDEDGSFGIAVAADVDGNDQDEVPF